MKFASLVLFVLTTFGLAQFASAEDDNRLSAEEQQAGWRLLFDGRSGVIRSRPGARPPGHDRSTGPKARTEEEDPRRLVNKT